MTKWGEQEIGLGDKGELRKLVGVKEERVVKRPPKGRSVCGGRPLPPPNLWGRVESGRVQAEPLQG